MTTEEKRGDSSRGLRHSSVDVNDKTKFAKSGAAATLKGLKVGDKVVVHAGVSGDKLVANEVRSGAMKGKQSMEGMKGMDMDHK